MLESQELWAGLGVWLMGRAVARYMQSPTGSGSTEWKKPDITSQRMTVPFHLHYILGQEELFYASK